MILQSLLVFVPALLNGILLAHLLWPEKTASALAVKLFLGIGLGLGLRSLLYFLYLLVLPARNAFIYLDLASTLVLLIVTIRRQPRPGASSWSDFSLPRLTSLQRIAALVAAAIISISLLTTVNYLLRRRQGDWDAWMMFNRAARFLYIDQAHWLDSFDPQMDPIFHPDYPLFLAGDIVAGWELLGRYSSAIPMLLSALFSLAALGLLAASVASIRSFGQSALAVVLLWGLPVFVDEGARQMADVPMAFFILATGTLFFLYVLKPHPGLLALAGLSAGLGAWTKNEGTVLAVAATAALLLVLARGRSLRLALPFIAGAAAPIAILVAFRVLIAPSGDILDAALGGSLRQMLDPARHQVILAHLWSELTEFGSWGIPGLGIGVLPVLLLYSAVFYHHPPPARARAFAAGFIILTVQFLGYYAAYLVSPYDLTWHLSYSSTRIVLQIFPLLLLLLLAATVDVETVLGRRTHPSTE